jgi:hypothetical protein
MIVRVAILLIVVVMTTTPAPGQVAPPSDSAPPAESTIKGADLVLVRDVRAVAERIAAILRVPARPGFLAVRADEATRAAEARARADRLLPPEIAAARGRAWSDLGLGGRTDPADLVFALELDLAGMTFDASRARLLVDPTRLTGGGAAGDPSEDEQASLLLATGVAVDEPAAGHYVAHLLTDDPAPTASPTTDALLARAALAEGSANVAALILLFGGVGLEAEVVAGQIRPDDVLGGRLVAPGAFAGTATLSSFLQFVYLDGFAQAAALAKRGDFRRLLLERKQRRSTRDLIHLDRPPAAAVELPAPAVPASAGLVSVDRDSFGEEGIIVLVSLLTGKDNLGLMAGDGWIADAIWRYEPAGGATAGDAGATVWISRWQSDDEAKDFAYALERCLQSRFSGETLDDAGAGVRVLRRADGIHRLEVAGREVRYRVASPSIDRGIEDGAKKKAPERRSTGNKK